jgi:acetoin utilization deacetylase AcuC-like enzyme
MYTNKKAWRLNSFLIRWLLFLFFFSSGEVGFVHIGEIKMSCCLKKYKVYRRFSRREFLASTSLSAVGLCAGAFMTPLAGGWANDEKISDKQIGIDNRATGTGFVTDERYLRHFQNKKHPESPERLKAIVNRLKRSGLDRTLINIPPSVDPVSYIRTVHPQSHIKLIAKQAHDESICRLAVAGVLSAVDAVCTGKVANAFCAIRPPGHHATNTGEYGFCFYNNVAIAARYAQQKYGLKKILIVDWDYHHGNGTEWAFYDDPTVLFFSTHALYAFPRTGAANKTGKGKGQGFNINVPLPHVAGDKEIIKAFNEQLMPAANKFRPDLILISAGFDSRKDDPLGDFTVTDAGFAELTKMVMALAAKYSQARIVSMLEGGYNTAGLALAVEAHVKALME